MSTRNDNTGSAIDTGGFLTRLKQAPAKVRITLDAGSLDIINETLEELRRAGTIQGGSAFIHNTSSAERNVWGGPELIVEFDIADARALGLLGEEKAATVKPRTTRTR